MDANVQSMFASFDIMGVWRDQASLAKVFTTDKDMIPKPAVREMNLENPNKPPEIFGCAEDEKSDGEEGTYKINLSETFGNPDASYCVTWPELDVCRRHAHDRTGLRIT